MLIKTERLEGKKEKGCSQIAVRPFKKTQECMEVPHLKAGIVVGDTSRLREVVGTKGIANERESMSGKGVIPCEMALSGVDQVNEAQDKGGEKEKGGCGNWRARKGFLKSKGGSANEK